MGSKRRVEAANKTGRVRKTTYQLFESGESEEVLADAEETLTDLGEQVKEVELEAEVVEAAEVFGDQFEKPLNYGDIDK